ncbi:O-antigen ligase family protein [Patescibacteria group bacterium]|nr:O-antigen ligase family protein [Patescibacteria group bacterium]MCG2701644.1 O-antigen ligase family protein [Candidatus Parcubacteria bacterium]MBU4389858.1 O-antigen ligase family protein [Patescibacteria group bacterium]MBU4397269.1 O-antigen ligase family protein [Patescibacteria group bacterium]MBU4430897.1 O-antigen ligase family protein [Patescibacteria group bacterium]
MKRINLMISSVVALVLIVLVYFRNFRLSLPILNYSDKWIFVLSVFGLGLEFWRKKKNILFGKEVTVFLLLILISVVVSVFGLNPGNSLLEVRFLITGFLLYLFFVVKNNEKIDYFLFLWMGLNLFVGIVSLLSLLWPEIVLSWLGYFFDNGYLAVFSYDFLRGRIIPVGAIYLSFLMPVCYLMMRKKGFFGLASLLIFCLSVFSVIISNYRASFILVIFGILMLVKRVKKRLVLFTFLIIICSIVVSSKVLGFSVFDRFLVKNDLDTDSLSSRIYYLVEAVDVFKTRPFLGVGLGNFGFATDLLAIRQKENNKHLSEYYLLGDPHSSLFSWLAETGLFGISCYLLFLYLFFKKDLFVVSGGLYKGEKFNFIYILIASSWIYVLGSFLDAWPPFLFYNFCIFRGILGSYYKEI